MSSFRGGKLRFLYLLALLQLVGGPLVLLQVTVFCKLVAREAPAAGIAKATERAWNSAEFDAALAATKPAVGHDGKKSSVPDEGPHSKTPPSKQVFSPWMERRWNVLAVAAACRVAEREKNWTPVWPQAPPGPPPRLG